MTKQQYNTFQGHIYVIANDATEAKTKVDTYMRSVFDPSMLVFIQIGDTVVEDEAEFKVDYAITCYYPVRINATT